MERNVKEIYTKDGKSLNVLIQEWMKENSYFLYCKKDIEFLHVDKK